MPGIGDDVRRHLLDDSGVIIDKGGMRGVVDEASQFARHGIARKKNAGLEWLDLKPALPLTFVSLPGAIILTQRTKPAFQPTPKRSVVIERRHLPPRPSYPRPPETVDQCAVTVKAKISNLCGKVANREVPIRSWETVAALALKCADRAVDRAVHCVPFV